jgi:hypothetical protein
VQLPVAARAVTGGTGQSQDRKTEVSPPRLRCDAGQNEPALRPGGQPILLPPPLCPRSNRALAAVATDGGERCGVAAAVLVRTEFTAALPLSNYFCVAPSFDY